MNDPLEKFVTEVLQDDEVLKGIRSRLADGLYTEEQALEAANKYVEDHPEVLLSITERAVQQLALVEEGIELPPDGPLSLFKPSSKGLPRLNPLLEAALGERLQFDGDIPELRTGPLPQGAMPAVPIKTTARDPVALGVMLDNASKRVLKEVKQSDKKLRAEIEAIAGEGLDRAIAHADIIKTADEGGDLEVRGSAETDAPSYRRGQLPEPVRTRRPSGSSLSMMSPQEKREKAYKFFSTTQGRRSVVPVIREIIAVMLRSENWSVTEREFDPHVHVVPTAHHEWSVGLAGAGSTQAAFSVIDVAARVLGRSLLSQLVEKPHRELILEVNPINTVDVRAVGWAARVIQDDPAILQ